MGNEAPVTGSSPLGSTQLDTDGALWLGECLGKAKEGDQQGNNVGDRLSLDSARQNSSEQLGQGCGLQARGRSA